jgi:plastocyanin
MQNSGFGKHKRMGTIALAGGAMLLGFATGSLAIGQYTVSQKGREFTPKEMTLKRGEAMTIVNDDADLRHHAYIAADNFTFDSGDQEPGSKTSISFPVIGTFDVLCAIHPKMKLVVKVE